MISKLASRFIVDCLSHCHVMKNSNHHRFWDEISRDIQDGCFSCLKNTSKHRWKSWKANIAYAVIFEVAYNEIKQIWLIHWDWQNKNILKILCQWPDIILCYLSCQMAQASSVEQCTTKNAPKVQTPVLFNLQYSEVYWSDNYHFKFNGRGA